MSRPIEDYALIGDLQSAALVSRDGSIDWLCLPRFDSEACFAALLGDERYGYWQIAPARDFTRIRRRYRPGTLVLETEFTTASGVVRLTDCMPPRSGDPVLIRLVEGVAGRVDMRMTLAARFEYGLTLPRVRQQDAARRIVAGGQSLWVFSPLGGPHGRHGPGRPLHGRRGRPGAGGGGVAAVAPASAGTAAGQCPRRADRHLVAAVGGGAASRGPGSRRMAGRGDPVTDHPQGAQLRADGRPARRADHLAPPAVLRDAQLGLPLLLDPRRRRRRGRLPRGRRRR